MSDPKLVVTLSKGWSESARAAAAEARSANKPTKPVEKEAAPVKEWEKVPYRRRRPDSEHFKAEAKGETPAALKAIHDNAHDREVSAAKPPMRDFAKVEVTKDTADATESKETHEITHRITPPKTVGVTLNQQDRPIDYGEVNDWMKEKYGNKRGEASYHGMIDKPQTMSGLHFVVGQNIAKEKKAMMQTLGKTGDHRNHHYQALTKLYKEKQN